MKKFFVLSILMMVFLAGCSCSGLADKWRGVEKESYEGMTPGEICGAKGGVVKTIEVVEEQVEVCEVEGKMCDLNSFSANICKDIETGEVEIEEGTKFCGVKFSHCECKEICVEEVEGEEGWQDCDKECGAEGMSEDKAVCGWQGGECVDISKDE